ncbi:alanine/ornithine racemase family PLP-dependent enzyme [Algoriphagus sediminis]|uniref:Alanine/ornithine racemase family PLP-dependent enzyme n=1 Tax=Algoriphagus sediminis TaxID=3057113 RepID=A0ABT7YB39_9BACT|nr:alanine/ornithine racemase family PLP-dependent enzyme [Algoriphagus sediminis]MDN3203731.1 alanine/ornithine racemase family PLP-dependent enzyme [Algoriphagus sediminis]
MAYITLNRAKLKKNYEYLDNLFKENGIEWAIVTKMLCGYEPYLKEVLDLGIKEVCDARISNLKKIKKLAPDVQTVYIKPPAKREIENIVRYADASFNTEYRTIKLLSEEAKKQNKLHKVIIMIELGDLREGVMGDTLMSFYESIFKLPNIKVTGIGSNLNCLHGVMPSHDKFIQLSLYEQLIEAKFNQKIPWVTGGTSVVIPLLQIHQLPKGINHFRVGETLYFGTDLVNHTVFEGMEPDVIRLYAEIIEITRKPVVPIGTLEANPSGEKFEVDTNDYGRTTHRAILDLGLLDINSDFLIPEDASFEFVGASSDMLVIDIDDNDQGYKVGDLIPFDLKYMGALTLLNSEYIEKKVI